MFLILILVGSLSASLWSVLNVKYALLGKEQSNGGWGSTFLLGGSFLSNSLYSGIFWLAMWKMGFSHWPTSYVFWLSLMATVLINIGFEILRFRAYTLAPLSLIAPFAAVSPVLTILTSLLILRELPHPVALLGIMLIAVSIYLLHLKEKFSWQTIFKPFQNIWQNQGVRLAFLSSLPPALSIVFDKKAVIAGDPFSFVFLAVFFIGLGALLVELAINGRKKFREQIINFPWRKILLISFFAFLANVTLNALFLFTATANVSAVRRVVIIFDVILGYFILSQREDIKKRLLASVGVVIGVILIAIFR